MRFNLGPIPEEFVPNAEWQALDEPEPKVFVTRATVYVGLPIFALILSIWNLLGFLFGDIFRDLGFARQVLLGLCFYMHWLLCMRQYIFVFIRSRVGQGTRL